MDTEGRQSRGSDEKEMGLELSGEKDVTVTGDAKERDRATEEVSGGHG